MTRLLRREGFRVSYKRVHRLWRAEGLKVPKKKRKRRAQGKSQHACYKLRADHANHVWAWDFIFDHTTNGGTIKCLSIVDEHTRQCITLDVSRSITAENVIDRLAELFVIHGVPEYIRSDNGPEFVAKKIQEWLERLEIETLYVAPGSPWENGFAESFHSRVRDEFLSLEEFENLFTAEQLRALWKQEYNHHRPHSSLNYQTPLEFASQWSASAPVAALPTLQPTTAKDCMLTVTQTQLS
jgi:putative transposase